MLIHDLFLSIVERPAKRARTTSKEKMLEVLAAYAQPTEMQNVATLGDKVCAAELCSNYIISVHLFTSYLAVPFA